LVFLTEVLCHVFLDYQPLVSDFEAVFVWLLFSPHLYVVVFVDLEVTILYRLNGFRIYNDFGQPANVISALIQEKFIANLDEFFFSSLNRKC
jgi:hypothetical protein